MKLLSLLVVGFSLFSTPALAQSPSLYHLSDHNITVELECDFSRTYNASVRFMKWAAGYNGDVFHCEANGVTYEVALINLYFEQQADRVIVLSCHGKPTGVYKLGGKTVGFSTKAAPNDPLLYNTEDSGFASRCTLDGADPVANSIRAEQEDALLILGKDVQLR